MAARGQGRGNSELVFNRGRVSLLQDENGQELLLLQQKVIFLFTLKYFF